MSDPAAMMRAAHLVTGAALGLLGVLFCAAVGLFLATRRRR